MRVMTLLQARLTAHVGKKTLITTKNLILTYKRGDFEAAYKINLHVKPELLSRKWDQAAEGKLAQLFTECELKYMQRIA